MTGSSVLYLSYDGMLEPLGQSQVLAYLKRIGRVRCIHLISFEKSDDWANIAERERLARDIAGAGILWHPLRYHKRPSVLATAWDVMCGVALGIWLIFRHRLRIVHARSYVPSVMALMLKYVTGVKYLFDMRGFWADERVDGGLWPVGGRLYWAAKWFERRFLLNADCVVSLTQAAVNEMRTFPYLQGRMPRFELITTCADLELFRPDPVDSGHLATRGPFTLGYVGSVGVWYLFDEVLHCFQLLRERVPNARLHILNRGGHQYIQERLAAMNIDLAAVWLEGANHSGVSQAMQQMDAGIFFYKPSYSKMATAPTKLGEFLGCGVPCLANNGVGDMAAILENEQVGVAVNCFDKPILSEAIDKLLQLTKMSDIRSRCRGAALRHFSIEYGVKSYEKIYRELLTSHGG